MLLANIAHPNWLCIGDFNHILNGDDKFSFNEGRIIGSESFNQLISDLELCELAAFGQRFTWMNNREDDDFVTERLDRAFAIVDWIHTYPSYALQNLPIVHSDHGPIMLDFELRLVTDEEIESTVFQIGAHKAPGPNGIPAFFYQNFWCTIKTDVLHAVHAFFHSAQVTQAVQEAVVEAAIKARTLGYACILFLSDSKRTVQVVNKA
uniref:Uncharacterized protein n=1 Tax=Quercus lobata TaxID=97700 RepID=A0A7N2N5Z6_QUELO